MTMMNNVKFEKELTCQFETDMRNLSNFDPDTQKISSIYTLMGSKVFNVWAKKVQTSYV